MNYVKGANIGGFVKVADAMLAYGVAWLGVATPGTGRPKPEKKHHLSAPLTLLFD